MGLENKSVTSLKGIGPALAKNLAKLGIHNVLDVFFHLPFRYEDRTRITAVRQLRLNEPAVIEAEVVSSKIVMGRRRSLMVVVDDGTDRCVLRFFHFNKQQQQALSKGNSIRAYGEVRQGAAGMELYHPEYKIFRDEPPPLEEALTPIYSATEGVSQLRIRSCVEQAFALYAEQLEDLLPEGFMRQALQQKQIPDLFFCFKVGAFSFC